MSMWGDIVGVSDAQIALKKQAEELRKEMNKEMAILAQTQTQMINIYQQGVGNMGEYIDGTDPGTIMETEIVAEVVDAVEDVAKKAKQNVGDLLEQYNSTKTKASDAVSTLTDSFTLEGMDKVNEMVATAMKEINAFASNGKEKTTGQKAKSRALALIDPNNNWAGKWFNNATDTINEEKLKEQSINDVINGLVKQISAKRDEVINFVQAANDVKGKMVTSLEEYKIILKNTEEVLETAEKDSKEQFDAEYLATMLRVTIEGIQSDIKSQVDPLIAGARISVNQITSILPTIENDLKYKTGFKAFQQKLSDLNGMVKTTVELAANAGDTIRKDVNETIYQSLEMLSETGLDVNRLDKIHKEEISHQKKINAVMNKTQQKVQKTFVDMKQLSISMAKEREETTNNLLENYAKVEGSSTDI